MKSHLIAVMAVAGMFCNASMSSPVSGQGTWETTLQARDLNADGVADAFYDTVLDITWLRDANVNGANYVPIAANWVSSLAVGGVSGWRLPRMVISELGCFAAYQQIGGTDCGFNVRTKSGSEVYSEIAHLWYETLGNKAYFAPVTGTVEQPGWDVINTALFQNVQLQAGARYWIEQPNIALDWSTTRQWSFYMQNGYQGIDNPYHNNFAMAVHAGDVGVALVAEPESLALAVTALLGLVLSRRSRHSRDGSISKTRAP